MLAQRPRKHPDFPVPRPELRHSGMLANGRLRLFHNLRRRPSPPHHRLPARPATRPDYKLRRRRDDLPDTLHPHPDCSAISMKPIPVGTRGTHAKTVEVADLAITLDPSLAAVLSTPTMVAMMEQAAINAIKPYLDAGESSVGMSIEVSHSAATPPGHRARAEAEVTKVEGRRLEFAVRAFDDLEQIGSGSHRRAVIDAAKFNDRIKTKQKS